MQKIRPAGRALVSIHDVMPATLEQTEAIIRFLGAMGIFRLTLLVVPGKDWSAAEISQLRQWQSAGLELAGHGWFHRVHRRETIRHRLHDRWFSRNEAEHLSLETKAVRDIILCCYRWFCRVGLRPPLLYVPPAWALGRLSRYHLEKLPFGLYETLTGIHRVRPHRFNLLPVTGYMADTRGRKRALRLLNPISRRLPWQPLRVAIHPNDLDLPLAMDLLQQLSQCRRFLTYADLAGINALDTIDSRTTFTPASQS